MALFSRRKISFDEQGAAAETVGAGGRSPGNDPAPRPRRRTVGQLLRETRESYGSDIPRVAAALRIRASYLEAIESGRYDQLPGAVYAMGFVRAYAAHLGLDGEEAVRRFKLEAEGYDAQRDLAFPVPLSERSIPGRSMLLAALLLAVCGYGLWYYLPSSARPERVSPLPADLAAQLPAPPPVAKESVPPAVPAESAAPPAPQSSTPMAAPETSTSVPAASPAPPAVELRGGAGTTATLPSPASGAPTSPATTSVPAADASGPVAAPGTASPPAVPPSAAPLPPQVAALPSVPLGGGATPVPDQPHVYGFANGETRILIRATSDSWIQVRDRDHVPIFTRQLHPGDVYRVPDRPGLSMRTGHGAALEILVDGQAVPPIGGAVRPNVVLDANRLLAGSAVAPGE